MKLVTLSDLRRNLTKIMDQAAGDHDPVIVTRRNGEPMVLVSLEDFGGYEETQYLNRIAANRKALDEAIAELDRGERVDVVFDEVAGEFKPVKVHRQAAE